MNPASELRKATQWLRLGRAAEAAQACRAVLAKFPQREDAHTGLLAALETLGAWDEIEAHSTQLTRTKPGFAPAWMLLARRRLMQQQEALPICQRCVQLEPKNPVAHDYLGIACRRVGRLDEAVRAFQVSLRLRPGHLSTQTNLANALSDLGRRHEALRLYRAILAADPKRLDAAHNLGLTLSDLGDLAAAERQLRALLAATPGHAPAHASLGGVLQAMNRLDEAEAALRTALSLQPDLADAQANLLLVLHNLGRLDELQALRGRAVQQMPSSSALRLAEVVVALPKIAASVEQAEASLAQFDAGLDAYEAWRDAALREGSLKQDTLTALPFFLAYRQGNQRDRLSRFADLSERGKTWPPRAEHPPLAAAPGAPVRLGIVSAHIRRHSVWDIVLKGLVRHLDRQQFELTIYHLGTVEDAETEFARAAVTRWRDAAALEGAGGWADLIAADRQDVLFYPEIGMHPGCYLLAQQRLAPVQAAGWGHPITTGIAAVDLYFSGELIEPPGAQAHYREQLLRLPGTGCCTTPFEVELRPWAFAGAGDASQPVFLIAQGVFKFDPAFDGVFVEIAQRVGACRFVIPVADTMHEAAARLSARLAGVFGAAGLQAADFVDFVPWLSEGEFRQALQVCTVFLDCPGFSGYTTAWKAVHEGIPVVTWEGPLMRQRLAAGLLRKIGLHDAVATTREGYVNQAVALARADPAGRAARRQALVRAAAAADEDVSVVRAFEQALLGRLRPAAQPDGSATAPLR